MAHTLQCLLMQRTTLRLRPRGNSDRSCGAPELGIQRRRLSISRGFGQRQSTATSTPSALSSPSEGIAVTSLPRIEYSTNWTQVNIGHLEELLDKAHGTREFSQNQLDDEACRERRLQLAKVLSNSMAIVAAYTRASNLPGFEEELRAACSSGMESNEDWQQAAMQRRMAREKRLVGFVRVSGDATLVSTLYDVVVLPELQGLGLGSKLMRRACQDVFARGIGDVAAMVPPDCEGFFKACAFGPDEVCESKLMTIPQGSKVITEDTPPPSDHLHKDTLTKLLRDTLEKRQ